MKKLSLLFSTILFFLSTTIVSAFAKESFVTLSFPVRGWHNWNLVDQQPLDFPLFAYEEASASSLPVTWMLRLDAVQDDDISARLNDLVATDSSQLLGGLLEVTPDLASQAQVVYPNSGSFTSANRLYLSGYSPEDRLKLIDAYMQAFFDRFGFYPTTVAADHLDAVSLQYLQQHYSVVGVLVSGDTNQSNYLSRWGGPLFSSYLPSSNNSLQPAQSGQDKIDLTVSYWSLPDLNTFYTNQVNRPAGLTITPTTAFSPDYFTSLLDTYADKLLNESTHFNIRLDNDYQLYFTGDHAATKETVARENITDLFSYLRQQENYYSLRFYSLQRYSDLFKARHPETNVGSFYRYTDDDGTLYFWYQNPYYRLGLHSSDSGTQLFDFRLYDPDIAEDYYTVANVDTTVSSRVFALIDGLNYPDQIINLDLDLASVDLEAEYWDLIITQDNKILHLQPEKIVFQALTPPTLETDDLRVVNRGDQTTWFIQPQTPFASNLIKNIFAFVGLLLFTGLIAFLLGYKKKDHPPFSKLLAFSVLSLALSVVARSGWVGDYGLGLWGPNGHDAIFHLSVISSLKDSLTNLSHPQISGYLLQNYHLAFDYLTALLARLFNLPVLNLFFRLLPLLLGLGVIHFFTRLLHRWGYSRRAINLSLVFSFLTGSLGFLFYIFRGQPFAGESLFWSNQSVSFFLNPPFALSIFLLVLFLYFFECYQQQPSKKLFLFLILTGGLLAQVKVYGFLLLCLALLLTWQIKLLLGVGLVGLLLTLPTLGLSSSPFVFAPLWFPRSMFAAQDRFNWQRLVEAWQVYEAQGRFLRLALVNLFAVFAFLIGNLGVRLLGLKKMFSSKKTLSQKIVTVIVVAGIFIPLTFIQSVNPWNTIQFLYYSLFFLGAFTAKQVTDKMVKKTNFCAAIYLVFILLFTLPTTIGTLRDYFTQLPAARVSFTEMRALDLLSQQQPGIVLSPLYSSSLSRAYPSPKPLYAYTSTAYISALSGQPEFLADTINLDITGFDYSQRAKDVYRFFSTEDVDWAEQFLVDQHISYLYLTPQVSLGFDVDDLCLTKLFDSGEVNVYKVTCHD